MQWLEKMNEARLSHGFLTIEETAEKIGAHNTVFDLFSVLISKDVQIGKGNVFYTGVILQAEEGSHIFIGNENTFMTGTRLEAKNGGAISVGDNNLFGEGTVSAKSDRKDAPIQIFSNGRYQGRINLTGRCVLENGSQILGTIEVVDCILEAGGDYKAPNADLRGGVLKGAGTARNLVVKKGMVINGRSMFLQEKMEMQSVYHPRVRVP